MKRVEERLDDALFDLLDPEAEGPAPVLDDLASMRAINDALEEAAAEEAEEAGEAEAAPPGRQAGPRIGPWIGGLVAAAAVAGLVLLRPPAPTGGERGVAEPGLQASTHAGLRAEAPAMVFEDGTMRLWLSGGTADWTEAGDVDLHGGVLVADVVPGSHPEGFAVHTNRGAVHVTGTVFVVEVGESTSVRVHDGSVRVERPGMAPVAVQAGERLDFQAPDPVAMDEARQRADLALAPGLDLDAHHALAEEATPEVPAIVEEDQPESRAASEEPSRRPVRGLAETPSVDELLTQATEQRAARKWSDARKAYRKVRRLHPASPAACTVLLPIGELSLDRLGQGKAALEAFDAYILECGKGPLLEEARYGRARALKRLGKGAEERKALEVFLRDHPTSVRKNAVRLRLGDLTRAAGECGKARRYYETILAGRAGEKVEEKAQAGLAACAP